MAQPLNRIEPDRDPMETDPGWDLPHKLALAAGILLYLLALTGELLGWWNDAGLILGLAGLILGLWSALDVRGGKIMGLFSRAFQRIEDLHGKQDQMLGKQDQMLGKQDGMIEKQGETVDALDRIQQLLDDRLPGGA